MGSALNFPTRVLQIWFMFMSIIILVLVLKRERRNNNNKISNHMDVSVYSPKWRAMVFPNPKQVETVVVCAKNSAPKAVVLPVDLSLRKSLLVFVPGTLSLCVVSNLGVPGSRPLSASELPLTSAKKPKEGTPIYQMSNLFLNIKLDENMEVRLHPSCTLMIL